MFSFLFVEYYLLNTFGLYHRSWQGFGAAHRTARQQAFFESKRYENQVTDSSLPPPPSFTPEVSSSSVSISSSTPDLDAAQEASSGIYDNCNSKLIFVY